MSATLISASEPHEGDAIQTNTAVGGGKPLHRFMRGQPKITGVRHRHVHAHVLVILYIIMTYERIFQHQFELHC